MFLKKKDFKNYFEQIFKLNDMMDDILTESQISIQKKYNFSDKDL